MVYFLPFVDFAAEGGGDHFETPCCIFIGIMINLSFYGLIYILCIFNLFYSVPPNKCLQFLPCAAVGIAMHTIFIPNKKVGFKYLFVQFYFFHFKQYRRGNEKWKRHFNPFRVAHFICPVQAMFWTNSDHNYWSSGWRIFNFGPKFVINSQILAQY